MLDFSKTCWQKSMHNLIMLMLNFYYSACKLLFYAPIMRKYFLLQKSSIKMKIIIKEENENGPIKI